MKITSIDNTNRLFLVENLLPPDLVNEVLTIDWQAVSWKRGYLQETWSRRQLDNNPVMDNVNDYISNHKDYIGEACGVKFETPFTMWWYDEPGFDVGIHTDGHLPATMQMFWHAEDNKRGTVFYNSKNSSDIKQQFQFVPNTGYIMLNGLNKDGSQPLQWHGMLNRISQPRITSYTVLGPYTVK